MPSPFPSPSPPPPHDSLPTTAAPSRRIFSRGFLDGGGGRDDDDDVDNDDYDDDGGGSLGLVGRLVVPGSNNSGGSAMGVFPASSSSVSLVELCGSDNSEGGSDGTTATYGGSSLGLGDSFGGR